MRLLKDGEIINLTDLLDRVFGIEGMAVVICTVQNRLYNDVVFVLFGLPSME